jgi:rod shape determining protein RodA
LWILLTVISIYGLVLIKSASRSGVFNCFYTQAVAVFFGFCVAFLIQFVDYKFLLKNFLYIGFLWAALMIYTIFFGIRITGMWGVSARAWITIPGGITIQPSEIAKIGFILTFAAHLEKLNKKSKINDIWSLAILWIHVFIPVVLAHVQGDDGAAIVFLCIAFFMVFVSEVRLKILLLQLGAALLSLPVLWHYTLAPYQRKRILSQLNPEADPFGMGYQQIQGKLSIGSGKFFGKGLFKGTRVASGMVPIQESDFIFSVAGEELGFIGCTLILALIFIFLNHIISLAKKSSSIAAVYICFGFFGLIMSQTILNIGMCLGFLPVVGVTLPFFSAGGSSLVCLFIGSGILQSIHIENRLKND